MMQIGAEAMLRTQIQLTEEQSKALKRRAARDGISMAEAASGRVARQSSIPEGK